MTYIIKIKDKNAKAKSIIEVMKALSVDYDFREVYEDREENLELTYEQKKELDRRLKDLLDNPENGKSWEDIKQSL